MEAANPIPSALIRAFSGSLAKQRQAFLISLSLGIFTFAIFWPVVYADFVNFDDGLYVTDNPQVQRGLTFDGALWAFVTSHASNWHPVVWLSHMLDCSLFGLFPGGHHLTNLLLHVANTVLLFLLLQRLTGTTWRSSLVAALFGWHPLHVESVAWIAERKDLLSTLFWILTLWAYARYVECPGWRRSSLALLLFALGLMTKPMLVTLPFVLLLLDYWPLGRLSTAEKGEQRARALSLLREKLPFFVLSVLSCLVTIWAQHKGGAIKSLDAIPLSLRLANAISAYGAYLWKAIWPVDLAVLYPMPKEIPLLGAICSGLILAAVSLLAVRNGRRQPALLVGWLWYLGTLIPVIGLVQVGGQAMADRYTYVPLIGIFIGVLWGLGDWKKAWPPAASLKIAFAGLVLAAFASGTIDEVRYWQDGETLFARATRVTKGNYVAYNNLGTALSTQGRTVESIAAFNEALRLNPIYAAAKFNLATELANQGQITEAVAHLNEIVRLKPKEAEVHNNLGVLLAQQGQLEEALAHFTTAIELKPDYLKAHLNLAMALKKLGRTADAVARYRVARQLEGKSYDGTD